MTPKIAMCACGEPLVCTFHFYKKEFVCVRCGRTYEFFGPSPADETPKLLARMEENEKLWNEIEDGYLVKGMILRDTCELCQTSGDYSHKDHATPEELEKHEQAAMRIDKWREGLAA